MSGTNDTRLVPYAALVLAFTLWAGNFVVGRVLGGRIDPETLNFLRWCLAAAVFLPFTARGLAAHSDLLLRNWRWILALALTGVVAFQQALYTALVTTPVANAALMMATTPVLILATSSLLDRKPLKWNRAVAVVLSLFGIATILGDGDPRAVLDLHLTGGDFWLLVSVTSWTAYTQLLRRGPKGLPADVGLMASILAGLPFLAVIALLRGHTEIAAISWGGWAGVAYVGLGAALAAFRAYGYGVARLGPDIAGLFINLMPVMSIVLAWAILGEAVTAGQMLGASFVIAALALGTRG